MKLIIQRVTSASVVKASTGQTVGKIGKGLFILVGIRKGDTKDKAEYLANKLIKLRIMSDEADKMNKTLSEVDGKLLVVSQFTLYANTKDGNRPSFIEAEEPNNAQHLYLHFIDELKKSHIDIQTGSFGEYMKIDTLLDGPVTIVIEA